VGDGGEEGVGEGEEQLGVEAQVAVPLPAAVQHEGEPLAQPGGVSGLRLVAARVVASYRAERPVGPASWWPSGTWPGTPTTARTAGPPPCSSPAGISTASSAASRSLGSGSLSDSGKAGLKGGGGARSAARVSPTWGGIGGGDKGGRMAFLVLGAPARSPLQVYLTEVAETPRTPFSRPRGPPEAARAARASRAVRCFKLGKATDRGFSTYVKKPSSQFAQCETTNGPARASCRGPTFA
jgi:hypothetical protein